MRRAGRSHAGLKCLKCLEVLTSRFAGLSFKSLRPKDSDPEYSGEQDLKTGGSADIKTGRSPGLLDFPVSWSPLPVALSHIAYNTSYIIHLLFTTKSANLTRYGKIREMNNQHHSLFIVVILNQLLNYESILLNCLWRTGSVSVWRFSGSFSRQWSAAR